MIVDLHLLALLALVESAIADSGGCEHSKELTWKKHPDMYLHCYACPFGDGPDPFADGCPKCTKKCGCLHDSLRSAKKAMLQSISDGVPIGGITSEPDFFFDGSGRKKFTLREESTLKYCTDGDTSYTLTKAPSGKHHALRGGRVLCRS